MSDIQEIKRTSKEIRAFQKYEWELADLEYFGKKIDWTKKRIILKATDNGEIAGILELTTLAGVIYIESLIVNHKKQRQGIGTELMHAAEKIAKINQIHKIFLNTSNTPNTIKFYESLGYLKTGEHPNHHKHKDYLIYSKFL